MGCGGPSPLSTQPDNTNTKSFSHCILHDDKRRLDRPWTTGESEGPVLSVHRLVGCYGHRMPLQSETGRHVHVGCPVLLLAFRAAIGSACHLRASSRSMKYTQYGVNDRSPPERSRNRKLIEHPSTAVERPQISR